MKNKKKNVTRELIKQRKEIHTGKRNGEKSWTQGKTLDTNVSKEMGYQYI